MDPRRPLSFWVLGRSSRRSWRSSTAPCSPSVPSLQGPDGGLVFPMRGTSPHGFRRLLADGGAVDLSEAFGRSLRLALTVEDLGDAYGIEAIRRGFVGATGAFASGLGAHPTWTLPFGLLVMFAVSTRFEPAFEEAARDLGATRRQTFRHATPPIIAPVLFGVAVFGFTLSWDELARSSQVMGADNTLPMQLAALTTTVTTPEIYALGTTTSAASLLLVLTLLGTAWIVRRRRAAR